MNTNSKHVYNTSDGTYSGTASLGNYSGEWYTIKLPYRILINHFTLRSRGENTTDRFNQSPKDFTFVASNDGGRTWVSLSELVNQNVYGSQASRFNINTNVYYDYFGFIVHKNQSVDISGNADGTNALSIAEWRLFGYREQVTKQSVLHDGQMTLTKNLTVPRIGPALDADDTPRRDRLVVEYNTSTNPTFEGAVRDTSGRGLDGALFGGAYYDANEKALKFDGSGDYTRVLLPQSVKGNWIHSVSCWVKGDVINGEEAVWNIGQLYNFTKANRQSTLAFNATSPTLRWYFYSNDSNTDLITIKQREWNHIVCVYIGGTSSATTKLLYGNGVNVLFNSIS